MSKTITDVGIQSRLIALVEIVHAVSRRSFRQLAIGAEINKNMLARCLKRERAFEVSTVSGLIEAAGLQSAMSLTPVLICEREALELWLSPGTIAVELDDLLADFKSKWGIGAARLVGERLAEHPTGTEHLDLALAMPRAGA